MFVGCETFCVVCNNLCLIKLLSVLFWTELVYVSIGIVCCRYTVRLLVILTVRKFSCIVFLIFFFFFFNWGGVLLVHR